MALAVTRSAEMHEVVEHHLTKGTRTKRRPDVPRHRSASGIRLVGEALEERRLLAGDLVINEFLARNDGGLRDGNDRSSDWIEIRNAGDAAVDLAGYRLTDDARDLAKWTFPSVVMEPNAYLVVFASGAASESVDAAGNLHTNFALRRSGEYVGLVDPDGSVISEFGTGGQDYPPQLPNVSFGSAQQQPRQLVRPDSEAWYAVPLDNSVDDVWRETDFVSSLNGFLPGMASLGFERNPGSRTSFVGQFQTELPASTHGVYTRIEFHVDDASAVTELQLRLKYDNGFIAYLNGSRIAADRAPDRPSWISAAVGIPRGDSVAMEFAEFDLSTHRDQLRDGKNVLAIHGLNDVTRDDEDMLLVPELLAVFETEQAAAGYLTTPTPGGPNQSDVFSGFVADTRFSVDRGIYSDPVQVEITTETAGATIRYTTDGSAPTRDTGAVYAGPITISNTTTLRAAAFKADFVPTNVDTHTYLFPADVLTQTRPADLPTHIPSSVDFEIAPDIVSAQPPEQMLSALTSIPTLSLVADVDDLFGRDGAWVNGGSPGGNNRFEQPVSVELIYPAGRTRFEGFEGFQIDAGLQPHGTLTVKHALQLEFKGRYGPTRLRYPFFESAPRNADSAVDSFDRLILRGGNNMSWHTGHAETTFLRDQWVRDTQIAMSGVASHGTFVHLYLNGAYFGLFNPVEAPDHNFMASYFGGEPEDWFAVKAIIERQPSRIIAGDRTRFDEMVRRADARDLADPVKYEEFQQYLDIDAYIDYVTLMWYAAIGDTLDNNWHGGMRENPAGPFRFFTWDSEAMLTSLGVGPPANRVAWVPPDFRPGSSNDTRITKIWRALWDNEEFRLRMADRVYVLVSQDGLISDETSIARLDALVEFTEEAILAESAKWGNGRTVQDDWLPNVQLLRERMTGNGDRLIEAMRRFDYYPSLDPPALIPAESVVKPGAPVTLDHPSAELILYTLDGTDPRLPGGEVAPSAIRYDGTRIVINDDTTIKARARSGGEWSALQSAELVVAGPDSPFNLRITEINYQPHAANLVTGLAEVDRPPSAFEFVEIANSGTQTADVSGVRFTSGIEFEFPPGTRLGPGERVVVVSDPEAFRSRYGSQLRVMGSFAEGSLSNAGEVLELSDAAGRQIQSLRYGVEPPWPQRGNGRGSSLELIDLAGDPRDPGNWRASSRFGGSPGVEEAGADERIAVTEILAHVQPPLQDMIELHNSSEVAVDISQWYVSNSDNYFKFQVPDGTVVPAGEYWVFTQSELGFDLDGSHGDELWVLESDARGRPIRFVTHLSFPASAPGVSLGPWPEQNDPFRPLDSPTLGRRNAPFRPSPVIVSELHFAPMDPDGGGRDFRADQFEFVELYNRTPETMDVSGWQLTGDIELVLPPETKIEPRATLLAVPFNPSDATAAAPFRFVHGITTSVSLVGPYQGRLSDDQGRVQLIAPHAIADGDSVPFVTADEIPYEVVPPWPTATVATGNSLTRTRSVALGDDAASWLASPTTPGTAELFTRQPGDSNEDGRFDQRDLVIVLQGGRYLTNRPATWREGDWNEDGVFDPSDIVAALQVSNYLQGPYAVVRER